MKPLFEIMQADEFEQVVYGYDKHSGLKALISIHNTALGPAFGGTRMMPYEKEEDALADVLKLGKAMTWKKQPAATAFGCFEGIKAAVNEVYEDKSLKGKKVAIQGVGNIGSVLAKYLIEAGAEVIVADVNEDSVARLRSSLPVEVVKADEILGLDVDILSPCALGGILNDDTIPKLKCRLIAGSANNQLADEKKHSQMLKDAGIAYAVDFIMSAGGVINNSHQFIGYNRERAYNQVAGIGNSITKVFKIAAESNTTTYDAAMILAKQRIDSAIMRKSYYLK